MSDLIKTKKEIRAMREGGKILAEILEEIKNKVAPEVTTAFLNDEAMKLISASGARPSFLGYRPKGVPSPYPAALCTSVNDEIVHAVPSKRKLKEGDIIGLDLGIWYKDMCVDSALTVGVGKISAEAKKLIETARQSLDEGISVVRNGGKTGVFRDSRFGRPWRRARPARRSDDLKFWRERQRANYCFRNDARD